MWGLSDQSWAGSGGRGALINVKKGGGGEVKGEGERFEGILWGCCQY